MLDMGNTEPNHFSFIPRRNINNKTIYVPECRLKQ